MNDQRQVIFSQRLKILKETDINNILEGFFEEILGILSTSFKNYKKSNDEQFLKEIKNVTGNSLDDKELNKLSSQDEENFRKSVKNLFFNKQKSRIEILGKEQNKDFEKKVFLQIIDFSWRSHLQYLEQLRQVIGLRQYGQKDPLSEFKKEAFVLFESLLLKIKNDLIKFLLNLNIVVSEEQKKVEQNNKVKLEKDFKKVGRNERCPCGSGKKFKYCHGNI